MWCIVNLPNGTQQAVKWDPKANGQECLEKVCKALDIVCEMEYFGLEHWTPSQEESRTRQWINLRNRLTCDGGSSGVQLMLALRVKFWVPVHTILQESARNLFYMQARVDLLERRLAALDWAHGAKLAALLCQADGIRFNELALKAKCPIRMRREQEALRQQQDVQCAQLAQKERKDKEHVVLSFKKRRLSKQKSIENIDNSHHSHGHHHQQQNQNTSAAAALLASARTAAATPSSTFAIATTTTGMEALTAGASISSTSSSVSAQTIAASSLSTLTSQSSTASPAFSPSNASTNSLLQQQQQQLETCLAASPLRIYLDYVVRPSIDLSAEAPLPEDFLRQIAVEHGKLALLKMTQRSAKYWLLQEIQELDGYGEELFCGVTTNENSSRCDIAVGAHGITVCTGDDKNHIPFSAIAAAKSFRRTFKLEYVNDHNDRKELEIKLPRHAIAAGLYRSITERHAFYVCDKVRGVVTNQFTRDLKGTIASMFKEDTELGKRYVFDIQHTCREVHDQARRILHERGIATGAGVGGGGIGSGGVGFEELLQLLPRSTSQSLASGGSAVGVGGESYADGAASCSSSSGRGSGLSVGASCSLAVGKLDLVIREKEEREAAIERCVDTRISEAMTCKICMDRPINTMFNPCCHVMACTQCADRCTNCPNCRVKITSVVKIYLPPELRTSQSCSTSNQGSPHQHSASGSVDGDGGEQVTMPRGGAAPKITA